MNCKLHYTALGVAISVLLFNVLTVLSAEETLRSPLQASGGGWSTPSPSGWTEPVGPSSVSLFGAAELSGAAAASNTHSGVISVSGGSGWVRESRRKMVQADPVARFYFERDP